MTSFLTALRVLTVFRWPTASPTEAEEIGKSVLFFPLIGFCLGGILILVNWLLDPYLASEIVSVLLVALLILLTRALPLEALKTCFDEFETTGGTAKISGLLAILVVVALKFRAIEVMGDARTEGLLLAPMLGRWAMVILGYGSESAGKRLGQGIVEQVRGTHLLLATAFALLLVTVFAGRLGLWIALWISLLTLLSRGCFRRCADGITADHLGTVGEISETLVLVLFASL
jgi:adenosylcobinamide-GDP ribazoletransferase